MFKTCPNSWSLGWLENHHPPGMESLSRWRIFQPRIIWSSYWECYLAYVAESTWYFHHSFSTLSSQAFRGAWNIMKHDTPPQTTVNSAGWHWMDLFCCCEFYWFLLCKQGWICLLIFCWFLIKWFETSMTQDQPGDSEPLHYRSFLLADFKIYSKPYTRKCPNRSTCFLVSLVLVLGCNENRTFFRDVLGKNPWKHNMSSRKNAPVGCVI